MNRIVLALTLGFGSLALQAGPTVTLTGVDTNRGANVTFTHNGVTETGFAGVILATFNGVSISPVFCVDLFTNIDLATYDSNRLAPRVSRHEDRVAWLYVNQVSTVVSQDTGLAFQLAIWDIIHDNGDGLSAGQVSTSTFSGLTATQISLANAYIAASLGKSLLSGAIIYQNFSRTNGAPAQNLIGASTPYDNIDNPEPASAGLVVVGLALAATGTLRRRVR